MHPLRRPWRLAALSLFTVSLLASSSWAKAPGVLGTIERGATRLAKTRMMGREVTVVNRPGLSVWVRPGYNVIGVSRGLSQRGFFLGRDGKLSSADRVELGRMLRQHAPGITASAVRSTLRGSIQAFKARQRTLKQQDPVINRLLGQAAGVGGGKEQVLWQGSRGSIYLNRNGVLVGADRHGTQGFFLSRGAQGLQVQPSYLEGLREFLHRNR